LSRSIQQAVRDLENIPVRELSMLLAQVGVEEREGANTFMI